MTQKQEEQGRNPPASLFCLSSFLSVPSVGLKQLEGSWQKRSTGMQSPGAQSREESAGKVGAGEVEKNRNWDFSRSSVWNCELSGQVLPFTLQGRNSLYNVWHVRSDKWNLTMILNTVLLPEPRMLTPSRHLINCLLLELCIEYCSLCRHHN